MHSAWQLALASVQQSTYVPSAFCSTTTAPRGQSQRGFCACPCWHHGPCGCGTVLWAEPTRALGLQLSWGLIPPRSHFAQALLRKILAHHPENFLEQRPQSSSFPSIRSSQAILAFLPALPTWASFSQHIDTSLHLLKQVLLFFFETQHPRLDQSSHLQSAKITWSCKVYPLMCWSTSTSSISLPG